ncbi:chitin disaccharide deacetylase [Bacillus salipaludis]|uniref:Carbohydrate deacetylase n=1 Tax=Bacillus salipaludis TaxID=2547811 RepID=A0A4R5VJ81_9BACI|nr:chitin disaccharide deacetylase [Bacillus salipaludis]MDQ6598807.1 chitin disaccharide deacetylase [Bacillus salipaludis]TDK56259.1 chitin disaccharide deacetylase [Bacillus salipaludis]
MIQLIVNADDFGFSPGVNYGIIDSYLYGIVNSTTMMMNLTGTDHAIRLAKKNPELQVGIHLVLTCGKPLLKDVPSLVDKEGFFHSLSDLPKANQISIDELEREWTAQIERFISSGLKPSHFDSHHHVHFIEEFQPVIKNLSEKFGLPVRRNGHIQVNGVKSFSDLSLFDFYGEGVAPDYFNKLAERIDDGKIVEIMCHPAYLDNILLRGSSYTFKRLTEFEILTHVTLPKNMMLYLN